LKIGFFVNLRFGVVLGVVVLGVVVLGVVVLGVVVLGVVVLGVTLGLGPYRNWIPAMSSGPTPLRKSRYMGYMISTSVVLGL
jgi:hypothetical protein